MVCNHLFPIPEWIYPENQFISIAIGSKTIAEYVGGFSKICVAIFAFLSGYAMYYTYIRRGMGGVQAFIKETQCIFIDLLDYIISVFYSGYVLNWCI